MAGIKALSHVSMVPLVRDILNGKDLSKVTPRTVREEVISRLGNEITSDRAALKAAIKSALDVVLTDAMEEQQPNTAKPPAEEKDDIHSDQLDGTSALGENKCTDTGVESKQRGDEDERPGVPREPVEVAKSKKQQHTKKRTRATVEQISRFTSEKDFKQLKKVCRRLGCTAPPSRQKGSTMREKCSNVLAYLRSKGVVDSDPTRLKKEGIDAHKRRIEREKDLEGLDVRCVAILP